MEGKAYREAGMFMVRHMPLKNRTSRWPWLLDNRIRRKYFSPAEDETLLPEAMALYQEIQSE